MKGSYLKDLSHAVGYSWLTCCSLVWWQEVLVTVQTVIEMQRSLDCQSCPVQDNTVNLDCLQNATQDFNCHCRRANNFILHTERPNKRIIEPSLETHHRTAAKDLVQRKTDCLKSTNPSFRDVYLHIHIKGTLLTGPLWIIFLNFLNTHLFMVFSEWLFSAHLLSVQSFKLFQPRHLYFFLWILVWAY